MAIVTCSNCGAPSPSQQLVCTKCGALLQDLTASTVHMRIDPNLLHVHRNHQEADEVPAGTSRTVTLQIRGLTERLVFEEGTEVVLGRLDLNPTTTKRFDLTRFGAHERGVSREHAVLRFQNNQLTIADLDSANGTTVNLERLMPREPYVLSNGDKIMLGRLSIVLRFDLTSEASKPEEAPSDFDSTEPTLRFPVANEAKEKAEAPATVETDITGADKPVDGKPEAALPPSLKIAPPADPDDVTLVHRQDNLQSADHSAPDKLSC